MLRRRLEVVIGTPFTEGNSITVLRNGDQIFPSMLRAIRSAEHTVDLMTFVYWKGDIAHDFAEAMADRATAGVRVRLLIDAVEVAVQVQPPPAPKGLRRRRTCRVHRRSRHSRGVVRRRAQRQGVARHSPAGRGPGRRRPSVGVHPELGRERSSTL